LAFLKTPSLIATSKSSRISSEGLTSLEETDSDGLDPIEIEPSL